MEEAGGEYLSLSPRWSTIDDFTWHKNVPDVRVRHRALLDEWASCFSYFLTGLRPHSGPGDPAPPEVIKSVSGLVRQISEYVKDPRVSAESLTYPDLLSAHFARSGDDRLLQFSTELSKVYDSVRADRLDDVLGAYHTADLLRSLWGAPYHYVSIAKSP